MNPKQLHRFWIICTAEFIASKIKQEGCFIECGVKHGTSAKLIAKQMQRNGFLFDTWQGFPHVSDIDAPTESRKKDLKNRFHGKDLEEDCKLRLEGYKVDHLCKMIKGDICETVPDFVKNNDIHIAYMHIDTDIYEPAKISFKYFGSCMMPGSGIFVHDYGAKKYPGIRVATDDFMENADPLARLFIFPERHFCAAFITFGGDELDSEFRELHAKRR